MHNHFWASKQAFIVNNHLLKKLSLFFEFTQLFILLLFLFFQSLNTIMDVFVSVEKICLANKTFYLLFRAFFEMKLEIETIKSLIS